MSGIGGGVALVAFLSGFGVFPVKEIVGLTAPILMVGNATRLVMFRQQLDRPAAGWFVVGAAPAALAMALVLPRLPVRGIQVGMAVFLLSFVAARVVWRTRTPARQVLPAPMLLPVGIVSGAASAAVGGAGPLSAPFFHARGLVKGSFAATNAACNGSEHAVKTVVFLANGVLAVRDLPMVAVAAVAVTLGNRLGKPVLGRISEQTFVRLLLIAIAVSAVRLLVG